MRGVPEHGIIRLVQFLGVAQLAFGVIGAVEVLRVVAIAFVEGGLERGVAVTKVCPVVQHRVGGHNCRRHLEEELVEDNVCGNRCTGVVETRGTLCVNRQMVKSVPQARLWRHLELRGGPPPFHATRHAGRLDAAMRAQHCDPGLLFPTFSSVNFARFCKCEQNLSSANLLVFANAPPQSTQAAQKSRSRTIR